MVIPRGHPQKEAGPLSSGNALNLVPYLPPLETISSSLAYFVGINRLFYRCTAPCNYGFNDSLCDFVGINRVFYSSLQLWLYRFLVGETRQSGLPILAGRSSKKRKPCFLKVGSERCSTSS